ncbi:MAG: CocE/NonD family hydrolase [Polyangiales bacterium]
MGDGVSLATDVWRETDTPRPTLLRRTPYGRAIDEKQARKMLDDGYVVVSQDVRGRGNSAGIFLPFSTDEADGHATIAWITSQPWSNGKVGMYSGSAEGIVQYQAMANAPPGLACVSTRVATHDVYSGMVPGGAWRTDLDSDWLTMLGASSVIGVWRAHEVRDAFWDALTLTHDEMAKVAHPVSIVGGFFDIFAPDQARLARELPRYAKDVSIVLGPWTHGGWLGSEQGQLRYPHDVVLPLEEEQRAFFAYCLQGKPRPSVAKVRYYITELGDTQNAEGQFIVNGSWREDTLWPPAAVHTETLFLAPDNRLGQALPAPPVELPLDPANPMPSLGGGNFSTAAGPHEQSELDRRKDVYLAATPALSEAVELVGSPRAFVWAASATDDIDVVVRIEQVTPSGKVIAFADGIQRGRFVRGHDAIRPLTPGEPTLFELELGPLALRLTRGAALRIAISGASSPRYEPNPNRALPLSEAGKPVATTLTIFRDPAHPSRIELPVLHGALPGVLPAEVAPRPVDASAPPMPREPDTAMPAEAESPPSSHGCGLASGGSWALLAMIAVVVGLSLRRLRR